MPERICEHDLTRRAQPQARRFQGGFSRGPALQLRNRGGLDRFLQVLDVDAAVGVGADDAGHARHASATAEKGTADQPRLALPEET